MEIISPGGEIDQTRYASSQGPRIWMLIYNVAINRREANYLGRVSRVNYENERRRRKKKSVEYIFFAREFHEFENRRFIYLFIIKRLGSHLLGLLVTTIGIAGIITDIISSGYREEGKKALKDFRELKRFAICKLLSQLQRHEEFCLT